MKKITIILLSVLYLAVTCGISVNLHYCMGKFRGVYIGYSTQDECSNCGMAVKKSGCCHDSTQWFKVDDKHQFASQALQITSPLISDFPARFFEYHSCASLRQLSSPLVNAPPPKGRTPDLNTLHCVFRI